MAKDGKGSGDGDASRYAGQMADIANQYWGYANPLLGNLSNRWMDFLGGGMGQGGSWQQIGGGGPITSGGWKGQPYDPMMHFRGGRYYNPQSGPQYEWVPGEAREDGTSWDYSQSPMWGPGKRAVEEQYGRAIENIISNLPEGGLMQEQLSDAATGKAQSLVDLASQIAMDEYNKIYGFATGAPQITMSGLGGAANSMAGLQGQQEAGKMGALGDIGLGTGMVLSRGKGGK